MDAKEWEKGETKKNKQTEWREKVGKGGTRETGKGRKGKKRARNEKEIGKKYILRKEKTEE